MPPSLAMEIVEEAVLTRLSEPAVERTRDAMIAGEVNGVLMAIYANAPDSGLKNQAIDLFDRARTPTAPTLSWPNMTVVDRNSRACR